MELGIKDRVIEWAKLGGDFRAGLSLFLSYNRNIYYAANIEAKGAERGRNTLISEFSNKTKLPVNEIRGIITNCTNFNELHEGEKGRRGEEAKGRNGDEEAIPSASLRDREQEQNARINQKRTTKLREEFPFLGRRDCPDELAILVNKMLSAYDDYRNFRKNLYSVDVNDLTQCYEVSRSIVDAHIYNREIWEELNYYKLHKKILGKLPEFKLKGMTDEYTAMGTVNLVKIVSNNIPRKMSYYKKLLADDQTKNMDDIRQKMKDAAVESDIIKGILKERGEM